MGTLTQCRYPGAEGRDSLKKCKRTFADSKPRLDRRAEDRDAGDNELKFAGGLNG